MESLEKGIPDPSKFTTKRGRWRHTISTAPKQKTVTHPAICTPETEATIDNETHA
jgi:hypothetical protein